MSHTNIEHSPPEHLSSTERRELMRQKLAEMYAENIQFLNQASILEIRPDRGEIGIHDRLGNFYPVPTFAHIWASFEQHWAVIEYKWSQGFTKLQLTPFALPLAALARRLSERLVYLAAKEQLSFPDTLVQGPRRKIILGEIDPIGDPRTRKHILEGEKILYFPDTFHTQGYTKTEEVEHSQNESSTPGWFVCLVEEDEQLAQKGSAQMIGDRKQLEVDGVIEYYIKKIRQDACYEYETGFTLDDFFTHFLMHLLKTHHVSSSDINNSGVWCIENRAPFNVPGCYWSKTGDRMVIGSAVLRGSSNQYFGAPTIVRLSTIEEQDS